MRRLHRGDTARSALGMPTANYEERMRRAAAGKLDEGNRLMYPHSVVEILLMGIMQDCQKRNGAKRLSQHAHAEGLCRGEDAICHPKVSVSLVRYPCYPDIVPIE